MQNGFAYAIVDSPGEASNLLSSPMLAPDANLLPCDPTLALVCLAAFGLASTRLCLLASGNQLVRLRNHQFYVVCCPGYGVAFYPPYSFTRPFTRAGLSGSRLPLPCCANVFALWQSAHNPRKLLKSKNNTGSQ